MTSASAICCFNGEFVPIGSVKLSTENRSFRYGDGLFETIRCFGNQPFLFDKHYERLRRGMETLQFSDLQFPTYDVLLKKIESVINKNRYFVSSRIRLTVFRNDGGLFTPTNNSCSYLIEATPLEKGAYEINEKGLIAGVYFDVSKAASLISPYKTASSLVYVMAGMHKAKHNLSEVFITNSKGLIIEAMSSNLFWIKDGVLFTPSVSSGCVDGIMRNCVMQVALNHGFEVFEVDGITFEKLKAVDEIFVTNAICGIQWVVGIDDVRFYNIKTRQLYRAFIQSFS